MPSGKIRDTLGLGAHGVAAGVAEAALAVLHRVEPTEATGQFVGLGGGCEVQVLAKQRRCQLADRLTGAATPLEKSLMLHRDAKFDCTP